ncbi:MULTISPECIES: Mov34/MPN/PAD-1 family protein [Bacillus cereus group]|uniref:Mov34/MPN/PAD-1 family protein n=1 Tax=Bacillus cereus group TaxID=86661 RepID=UPI000A3011A5|nr:MULTISPECIES: Mov34/MPN/PAD-1 family protein [Bacillus cereus group]QXW42379.1 Mov34/MPN/PAD-1 family protein [Klebsiella grimontii]MCU4813595.1 Mov34/MPN/PAD-1 family protein [Bacillus cereus]MCU5141987.1 Mov34/MPN/PAD-1 family protein [Bacillus cereus]MCU5385013.1 Mov34/MPN/PAD-1 family protein [Bacillus cereus]MDY8164022.1 Mov34/MPN/PAD-1 family protein [Bacillus thuringiensis]
MNNNKLEEVFILPDNKLLYIRPEALDKMNKYKQIKWNDTEAGGILIGRILVEDENYIIDDVSEPMSKDKRMRTRFSRKVEGHQEYFNDVWERANGRCFYLGEWHTHPQRVPIPSSIDRTDWNRLLKMGYETGRLFFIIIGIEELKVWYGSGEELVIIELKRRGAIGKGCEKTKKKTIESS